MAGHHSQFARAQQRNALKAALGTLHRFQEDLGDARKGDWTPRAFIAESRDELASTLAVLGPIIGDRVRTEVQLDREEAREAVAAKAERFQLRTVRTHRRGSSTGA